MQLIIIEDLSVEVVHLATWMSVNNLPDITISAPQLAYAEYVYWLAIICFVAAHQQELARPVTIWGLAQILLCEVQLATNAMSG